MHMAERDMSALLPREKSQYGILYRYIWVYVLLIPMLLFLGPVNSQATQELLLPIEDSTSAAVTRDSQGAFTASVAGIDTHAGGCNNATISQDVPFALDGDTSWNCEEAGLTFREGDIVGTFVNGRARGGARDVGGRVTGILPLHANCFNWTTNQSVQGISLHGVGSWNCEKAGLVINAGDRIRTGVRGTILAPPAETTCLAPQRFRSGVVAKPVFTRLSFSSLVWLQQAPGDSSRWFAAERGGRIYTFANDEAVATKTTFLDITDRVPPRGGAVC